MNNLDWLVYHDRDRLVKFLTDDYDSCEMCAYDNDFPDCGGDCVENKHAWLMAEHEPTNGNDSETNGIHADAPLVDVLRNMHGELYEATRKRWANEVTIGEYNAEVDSITSKYVDMVERNYMSREQDSNGTCPDAMGQSSAHSKAQSKTEPNLTEQSESLSDAISENLGKSQDSEIDSREKMEADVSKWCLSHAYGDTGYTFIIKQLDRQKAIDKCELYEHYRDELERRTRREDELTRKLEAATNANDDYRNEWHRVCAERMDLRRELTASKNEGVRLAEELGKTMAERDQWRSKCGAMLDAAQEIRRLADIE